MKCLFFSLVVLICLSQMTNGQELINFQIAGVNWVGLGIPYNPYRSIFWRRVQIKDNLAIAVGDEGIKARIMLLKR